VRVAGQSAIRTFPKEFGREDFAMATLMSNLAFNGMSLIFKVRDFITPRRRVLEEAGIKPGNRVLDYGCGPGAYIADAAEMAGESGRVYALDMHPLALKRVQRIAERRGLTNVETICSDCYTDLPDGSVDVVLLHDVFHMLSEPQAVLAELRRVLKPGGVLSFSDHHMKERDIITGMTDSQIFKLGWQEERTYTFVPRTVRGDVE
jgi:ubiquinone/menaquinone biosynthesis C-methylase UbiE